MRRCKGMGKRVARRGLMKIKAGSEGEGEGLVREGERHEN